MHNLIKVYIQSSGMTNNNVTRFANRVDNYVRYRPGYPHDMLEYIKEKIISNYSGAEKIIAADIGAGTGIFSKCLIDLGLEVISVEPNDDMRKAAVESLQSYKTFFSVTGTAENTGLPEHSVDLIFAAQAFHWFDVEMAKSEFKRILKSKDGEVILIWNKRLTSGNGFLKEYELLLKKFATDYNQINHVNVQRKGFDKFYGKDGYKKAVFKNVQGFDREGFIGRVFSSSYVPLEGKQYEIITDSLNKLFDEYNKNGKVEFVYSSVLYRGKLF